jgi:anti-sigma factor RsiW
VSHPTSELTAYLDGALAPAARAELEGHLAACPACRAERDRLASTIGLLAQLPRAEASPTFEQRFHARLAAERTERTRRRGFLDRRAPVWRWLAPGLAGAAAAAAVVIHMGAERRDERFLAEHLDLFENYEAVESVDALERPEDVAVVAHLQDLVGREGKP